MMMHISNINRNGGVDLLCVLWLTIFFYIYALVEPKDVYWSFSYEYFDNYPSNELNEDSLLDHYGNILHINISFPVKGKRTFLFLEPDSTILKDPSFSFTKIAARDPHLFEQKARKDSFIGFVEKNVAQKAIALLINGHWLIAFEGSDGILYNMEPKPRQSTTDSTPQSKTIYNIYKIRDKGLRGSHDPKGEGQTSMFSDDREAEIPPIFGDSRDKPPSLITAGEQNKQLKENKQDKVQLTEQRQMQLLEYKNNSFSKVSKDNFIDREDKTSTKSAQNPATTSNKSPCKVIVITDTKLWIRLGIGDPVISVSFFKFAYHHTNRQMWRGDSESQRIESLKIDHIHIFDSYGFDELESKDGGQCSVGPQHLNLSDILCRLRSIQGKNTFCIVQAIFACGSDRILGATVLAEETFSRRPPNIQQHDHHGFETLRNTFKEQFERAPKPQNPARIFKITDIMGCHQEVLSKGLFTHFIARQLIQSIRLRGRGYDTDSGLLTCGPNEEDIVKLRVKHSELDMDMCSSVFTKTNNTNRGMNKHQSSSIKMGTSRAKRSKPRTCGNGKVERGEECDPGPSTSTDNCCNDNCELRIFAHCSPKSSPCCTSNCGVAPSTQICKSVVHTFNPCVMVKTRCNGVDHTVCKDSPIKTLADFNARFVNATNYTRCDWQGICLDGECLRMCIDEKIVRQSNDLHNLTSCRCNDKQADSQRDNENCTDCCDDFKAESLCVTKKVYRGYNIPCWYQECPRLGCVRLGTLVRRDSPEIIDYMGAGPSEIDTQQTSTGKTSSETLILILRVLYWLVSSALLVGFSIFTVFTVTSVSPFAKSTTETQTQEA